MFTCRKAHLHQLSNVVCSFDVRRLSIESSIGPRAIYPVYHPRVREKLTHWQQVASRVLSRVDQVVVAKNAAYNYQKSALIVSAKLVVICQ